MNLIEESDTPRRRTTLNMAEEVTEQMLSDRWNDELPREEEKLLKDGKKLRIWYISAHDEERRILFYDCDKLEFKNENQTIWSKSGSGQITFLPPKIGVYIKEGIFGTYTQDGSFEIGPGPNPKP